MKTDSYNGSNIRADKKIKNKIKSIKHTKMLNSSNDTDFFIEINNNFSYMHLLETPTHSGFNKTPKADKILFEEN